MRSKLFFFVLSIFFLLSLFSESSSVFAANCKLDTGTANNVVPKGWKTIHLKISAPDLNPNIKYKIKLSPPDRFLKDRNGNDKTFSAKKDSATNTVIIDVGDVNRTGTVDPFPGATIKYDREERYTLTVVQEKHTNIVECNNLRYTVENPPPAATSGAEKCTIGIPNNYPPASVCPSGASEISPGNCACPDGTACNGTSNECKVSGRDFHCVTSSSPPSAPDTVSYKENIAVKVTWTDKSLDDGSQRKVVIKRKVAQNDPKAYQTSEDNLCASTTDLASAKGFSLPPDTDQPDLWPGYYVIEIKEKCEDNGKQPGSTLCSQAVEVKGEGERGGGVFTPLPTHLKPSPACPDGICKTAFGEVRAQNPIGVIVFLMSLILQIAGVIAFILLLIAGYRLMTSAGDKQKVAGARETITSAIIGLLLIIFSLLLFQFIGVDLLRLPGLKP